MANKKLENAIKKIKKIEEPEDEEELEVPEPPKEIKETKLSEDNQVALLQNDGLFRLALIYEFQKLNKLLESLVGDDE